MKFHQHFSLVSLDAVWDFIRMFPLNRIRQFVDTFYDTEQHLLLTENSWFRVRRRTYQGEELCLRERICNHGSTLSFNETTSRKKVEQFLLAKNSVDHQTNEIIRLAVLNVTRYEFETEEPGSLVLDVVECKNKYFVTGRMSAHDSMKNIDSIIKKLCDGATDKILITPVDNKIISVLKTHSGDIVEKVKRLQIKNAVPNP